MKSKNIYIGIFLSLGIASCNIPKHMATPDIQPLPKQYGKNLNQEVPLLVWKEYFKDEALQALIDTALVHNQELNIVLQEIAISKNEVKARKGEYLPSVGVKAGVGAERLSEHTLLGSLEHHHQIVNGKENPKPLPDLLGGFNFNWELDIWHKLRDAKDAAKMRYLASTEAKNFMVTELVSEIASTYYELIALDQQLAIVQNNITIQQNALEVVRIQKQATRATELAVKKFEAEVLKTQSMQYELEQSITEAENKINYLLGRYPQPIKRSNKNKSPELNLDVAIGLPAQLLDQRPDIKKAALEIAAANLDLKVAKANFYPSLGISSFFGLQAFNPSYWIKAPESILFNIAGDLVAPLVNKNGIKAAYSTANAKQIQAAFTYQQKLINAYVEVANQWNKVQNFNKATALKTKQVQALQSSIEIANDLFRATRADYMEVLMTQRDALEAQVELTTTQRELNLSYVQLYKALGGGWQ